MYHTVTVIKLAPVMRRKHIIKCPQPKNEKECVVMQGSTCI